MLTPGYGYKNPRGYTVFTYENRRGSAGLRYDYVEVINNQGKKKMVQVAFDDKARKAYVNPKNTSRETIEIIKAILR